MRKVLARACPDFARRECRDESDRTTVVTGRGFKLIGFIGNLLSPAGTRARLSVLMYHRTLGAPDPILHDEIDCAMFERHMALLAQDFNVLPLSEACERMARGALPARAAAITFDDGYADNATNALPILERLRLPATFFVASGYCDGSIMFNDAVIEAVRHAAAGTYDLTSLELGTYSLSDSATRRAAIDRLLGQLLYRPVAMRETLVRQIVSLMDAPPPKQLMMSPAQIKRLHDAGMEIGGHTITHPILTLLDDQQAREEIAGGKHRLEEIIGAPVKVFAYPNGKPGRDYGPRDVDLVRKAGFSAAVSTVVGIARGSSDPFQLPRFGAWDRDPRRLRARILMACARGSPASAPLPRPD